MLTLSYRFTGIRNRATAVVRATHSRNPCVVLQDQGSELGRLQGLAARNSTCGLWTGVAGRGHHGRHEIAILHRSER